MSGLKPGFSFDFEWRITLFTVVMASLMISLGFWQLQRAEEKASLALSFEERQHQRPTPLIELWNTPADALAYTTVRMSGTFLPDAYFLLDNQVRNGQFGYEVLGILQLSGAAGAVLVNRGWIAGDAARQSLPLVPLVTGPVDITAHIYVAPGEPYLLAEQKLDNAWPKRIQAVEMDKLIPAIAGLSHGKVFPFPVRIDANAQGALAVNWQVVNMSSQMHHGYAVQWFAMAAVLFVIYLLRCSNVWQLMTGSGRAGE